MTLLRREDPVVAISGFDGRLTNDAPPFGAAERAAIDRHWAEAVAEKPELFDGRVLLGTAAVVEGGILRAAYFETGFSVFHWWRAASPARGLVNVFGAAAVVAADGAILLGRMAAHTAMAGQVYFPCGTPDPSDLDGRSVDLDRSIERELREETGLAGPVVAPGEARFAVFAPKVCAYVRRYDTALNSAELRRRVETHLAAEDAPELDGVLFVRSADDLLAAAPDYVRLVLPRLLAPAP